MVYHLFSLHDPDHFPSCVLFFGIPTPFSHFACIPCDSGSKAKRSECPVAPKLLKFRQPFLVHHTVRYALVSGVNFQNGFSGTHSRQRCVYGESSSFALAPRTIQSFPCVEHRHRGGPSFWRGIIITKQLSISTKPWDDRGRVAQRGIKDGSEVFWKLPFLWSGHKKSEEKPAFNQMLLSCGQLGLKASHNILTGIGIC